MRLAFAGPKAERGMEIIGGGGEERGVLKYKGSLRGCVPLQFTLGERERRRSISDTIGGALSRGARGVQCSRAKEDGAYMSSGGVEATRAKARVGKKEGSVAKVDVVGFSFKMVLLLLKWLGSSVVSTRLFCLFWGWGVFSRGGFSRGGQSIDMFF